MSSVATDAEDQRFLNAIPPMPTIGLLDLPNEIIREIGYALADVFIWRALALTSRRVATALGRKDATRFRGVERIETIKGKWCTVWFECARPHRAGGLPAVQHDDGQCEFWLHGQQYLTGDYKKWIGRMPWKEPRGKIIGPLTPRHELVVNAIGHFATYEFALERALMRAIQ